jgi:hypothetical protein
MTMPGAGGDERFSDQGARGPWHGYHRSKKQWKAEIRRWKFRAFMTRCLAALPKILVICLLGAIILALVLLRLNRPVPAHNTRAGGIDFAKQDIPMRNYDNSLNSC